LNLNEISDEELIELICEDHWEAFEVLYGRYVDRIFTFLKGKVDIEQAQDLTQACFMKIHSSANTYDPAYPAAAWIYTIAKNLFYDEYRKDKRHYELNKIYKEQLEVEQNISTSNLWQDLQPHIERLDKQQQKLIFWRYQEGREFDEIANFLSVTSVNARQLVSRAVKSLKLIVSKEEAQHD
tara:strand:+ start:2018 stop:2563 length:546 start_codon:yes stop_codon:yes gene_type:complete